ncbi:MAG: GNAT family N-acetyltransferase [Betaproteobacteria bacterium]
MLLAELGTGRELLAVGSLGETAQAMTVLHCTHGVSWETFQPAQAPLGAWVQRPTEAPDALVAALLRALPGVALALAITRQDPAMVRRPEDRATVATADRIRTSRVKVIGGFDDFWSSRAKNMRNTLKQQRRLLEQNGRVLRLDTVTRAADVAGALDDHDRLVVSGPVDPGTRPHSPPVTAQSYRSLLEEFCRRGRGRIHRYWFDDAVVAIDLCIESKEALIVLNTACDEAVRESSPVSLMRQEYFRIVFDEARLKSINFYGNFMDGPTKWGDEIRTLYDASFYRWAMVHKAHRKLGGPTTGTSATAGDRSSPAMAAGKAKAKGAAAPTAQTAGQTRPWLSDLQGVVHALRRRPTAVPRSTDRNEAVAGSMSGAADVDVAGPTFGVTRYDSLTALPERYQPLFSDAGKTSLFHTLPWYQNFIQTVVTPKNRMRIYAVDTPTKPAAARAVLLMQYTARTGMFGTETLHGLSNYYSALFGPVIAAGDDTQGVIDALAAAIADDGIRWDVVDLHPLAVDARIFPALIVALRKTGLLVQTYFCSGNWYLQVNNQTFNEYFDARTSRLSKSARRSRANLESSGRFQFELFTDVRKLDRGVTAYDAVYNSSWKVPEPYPDFIPGLVRTCAEQGWLRLGVAYLDGTPAAAQIWTVIDGKASIYKIAYDERFVKESVGTVLTSLLMEHVIDIDKVHEVDYLAGDDAYKKDWMSDRRERWGIVAYNLRRPIGFLAGLRHLSGRAARGIVRSMRRGG